MNHKSGGGDMHSNRCPFVWGKVRQSSAYQYAYIGAYGDFPPFSTFWVNKRGAKQIVVDGKPKGFGLSNLRKTGVSTSAAGSLSTKSRQSRSNPNHK
jgi:hypothetical protein